MQKTLGRDRARTAASIIAAAVVVTAGCATASSPDAWEAFRQQVVDACVIESALDNPKVRVDPFGTESYGIASVIGVSDDGTERTVICVVRKSPDGAVDAEISADLDEWVAAPTE